jgi:catechol 2,3-dioxygenase-like lactoylglutathione lyase family enzyme
MFRNNPSNITAFSRAILAFLCTFILIGSIKFFQPKIAIAQATPSNTLSLQLHHVTLSANDVDLTAQWYVDYLGFNMTDRFSLTRPDGRQIDVIRIARPGLQLNISKFPGSMSLSRSTENQGWRHLAFEVEDVDRTYQQLRSQGVQFMAEPFTYDPPGYRVVFFRDPEGNILELYQENL